MQYEIYIYMSLGARGLRGVLQGVRVCVCDVEDCKMRRSGPIWAVSP